MIKLKTRHPDGLNNRLNHPNETIDFRFYYVSTHNRGNFVNNFTFEQFPPSPLHNVALWTNDNWRLLLSTTLFLGGGGTFSW